MPSDAHPRMGLAHQILLERRPDALARSPREALAAFAACGAAGLACAALALAVPLRAMGGDTVPGRFGAAVFACRGGSDLREVDWIAEAVSAGHRPYYVLAAKDGSIVSMYGPAPALLGAPFLGGLEAGGEVMDRQLAAATRRGSAMSVGLAATLLAAALCARARASKAAVLALVVGASFAGAGILGQALWQQTALLVPMTAALATITWASWRRGILLTATPAMLAVAAYVRPASIFLLAALTVSWAVAWRDRGRGLGWLALALGFGVISALPQAAWCIVHWGHILPIGQITSTAASVTDGNVFDLGQAPMALAGLLVGPARGLFWYGPILVVALVAAARRGNGDARLVAIAVVADMVLMAIWRDWWGGMTFGPRLLDEAMWLAPWMLVGAAPARGAAKRAVLLAAGAVTACVGLLGAVRYDAAWDVRRDPDHHPEALWDARDSPIASLLRGEELHAQDAPAGPFVYCTDRALTRRRTHKAQPTSP